MSILERVDFETWLRIKSEVSALERGEKRFSSRLQKMDSVLEADYQIVNMDGVCRVTVVALMISWTAFLRNRLPTIEENDSK